MVRILIIDDDVHIGNLLEDLLTREGYQVYRAYSGTEALLALSSARPDLVLLDLMLPGLSGEQVLPRLQGISVIVLSARADVDSKVSLLLGGAADYVTKPFDSRELLARIAVALRRAASPGGRSLLWGSLRLDADTRQVWAGETELHLTRTEYAILHVMLTNPTQVITKSLLLEQLTADTPDCTEQSLKMHVSNLRRKLREAGAGDPIESVWGIGFRLREAEKSEKS